MKSHHDEPSSRGASPWSAGILGRCPRCGRGALFRGLLTTRERCEACGLDYGFIDSGDGPAPFAIFFAGLVVVAGALWLEFAVAPPVLVHVLVWVPAVFVLTIGTIRPLKGWLIAMQYRHRAAEGRLADGGSDRP